MSTAFPLTTFQGRVGDHNDHAAAGARALGARVAARWGLAERVVGEPAPALDAGWRAELTAAEAPLRELGTAVGSANARGRVLTVMPRCAGALATVPVLAARHPHLCVVWLDAHPDLNLPTTTTSGYLGGMALSAPLGWWDSGHGAGAATAVLVGARDIDPGEAALIAAHDVPVVPAGADLPERLAAATAGRRLYVHLDCDVLDPGILPTDYGVPGGLDLDDLAAAARVLAAGDVVGLEVAELEAPGPAPDVDPLLDALAPLVDAVAAR